MGDRVRVLWLAKGLGRGGAEQLLVNCARHLDDTRYEVEVAYVLPWKDALVPTLRELGLAVHCLGGGWTWPLRLRMLLRARGYGLIHTHMPVPAVAARVVAAKVPIVHTEHNIWPRYRRATRVANAWTYRRNNGVIAVSAAVAESIDPARLRPGVTPTVIHHGPDLGDTPAGPGARDQARRALDLDPDAFIVGTVANFTPKKDQLSLLDAHALVRARQRGAVLVLIGSGPLEATLRERANRPDLKGSVVFTGSRGDVPALLSAFDVFALSSRQEGLPVSLMEAMTVGLPSVVTAVGGMPEIVTDGIEGSVVAPGAPGAFADALLVFAEDPARRRACGEAAHARSAGFDVAGAQRRIEDVYANVLEGTR